VDRLESLQLYIRIVELGSFTRASSELDVPRATATHAIKALETRLGTCLLERTTRQVRATPAGLTYYESCVRLLADLAAAESALSGVKGVLSGTVRVDVQDGHTSRVVLPRIDEFRQRNPHVSLTVSSGHRMADLVREGADCILRSGVLQDAALETRQIAPIPQLLCASPAYLRQRGVPLQPSDLVGHEFVSTFARNREGDVALLVDGERQNYRLNSAVCAPDVESQIACAVRGCGLIQMPRFQVERELREGQLVEVLPTWPSPALTVSVLYPALRRLTPAAHAFVDWVTDLYLHRFGASLRGSNGSWVR
jgi:DNA-binding transcriptional LysR family regulator